MNFWGLVEFVCGIVWWTLFVEFVLCIGCLVVLCYLAEMCSDDPAPYCVRQKF